MAKLVSTSNTDLRGHLVLASPSFCALSKSEEHHQTWASPVRTSSVSTKRFHVPWRMDDGREARPHRGSLDPQPFEGGSLDKVSLWQATFVPVVAPIEGDGVPRPLQMSQLGV